MLLRLLVALVLFLLVSTSSAFAADEGIGWIPTLDQAFAEARLSNKPILLVAGAPQCGGAPGVW